MLTPQIDLTVVVPVFNNEGSLTALVDEIDQVFADLNLELIFVNDFSSDNSLSELQRIRDSHPNVRVFDLAFNVGAVECSREGLRHCSGDYVSIVAADLQDPPEVVRELYLKVKHGGARCAVAFRDGRRDPYLVRLTSSLYYRLLSGSPNFEGIRTGFDMFVLRGDLTELLLSSAPGVFPSTVLTSFGVVDDFVYYQRPERVSGLSQWTRAKRFTAAADNLFSATPRFLRLASVIAFIVGFLTTSYGLLLALKVLLGQEIEAGFSSIVLGLGVLFTLVFLTIWIVGEYCWRSLRMLGAHRTISRELG